VKCGSTGRANVVRLTREGCKGARFRSKSTFRRSSTNRHSQFAVRRDAFPCLRSRIPCSDCREFARRSLVFQRVCRRGEGPFNGNSLYFPADQGISDSGDAFAAASQHKRRVSENAGHVKSRRVAGQILGSCRPLIWTYLRASRSQWNRVRYRWLRAPATTLADRSIRRVRTASQLGDVRFLTDCVAKLSDGARWFALGNVRAWCFTCSAAVSEGSAADI
jgi:hypothetical protein